MLAKPDHAAVRDAITTHYGAYARVLPWRRPPGAADCTDPYAVWLSEVMLQQTTVAAVIPYYRKFLSLWPDVASLAAAPDEAVLAAWAGLGYYSRARNLIACARAVVDQHDGRFPSDVVALRSLPGIGAYTAAAINAIAFGGAAVPIDANIERVVARLFAITTPMPAAKAEIAQAAQMLWPDDRGGDFAQALMDLGASVCSARAPSCGDCPVSRWCAGYHQGIADTLPVKPPRSAKPHRHGRALWHVRGAGADGEVRLVRRPPRGLLGGMRALPGEAWEPVAQPVSSGAVEIGVVRHVFTHFSLSLAVDRIENTEDSVAEGEWWPISRLDEAGLPTLYRRAAELALREN